MQGVVNIAGSVVSIVGFYTGVITYYYLKGKIKFSSLETALKKFILEFKLTPDNAIDVLYESIILADSQDNELANKCKELVSTMNKNGWHQFNPRDILKELEYVNFTPKWYKSFLNQRK